MQDHHIRAKMWMCVAGGECDDLYDTNEYHVKNWVPHAMSGVHSVSSTGLVSRSTMLLKIPSMQVIITGYLSRKL